MVLTDAYRFPFSLFVGARNNPGDCIVEKTGSVVETMDSSIGRSVTKIKGSVSANNYIDFSGINLLGHLVYVQLSLLKPAIATFHLELITTGDISLRVTFSTLYEQPRFLGRSLRIPLPPQSGWANLFFDVNQILELNCPLGNDGNPWKLKAIKRIQLCSNMLVRDVITSNSPVKPDPKNLPKELGVIASANLPWINITSTQSGSSERENVPPFSPDTEGSKSMKFFPGSPESSSMGQKQLNSTEKHAAVGRSLITPGKADSAMTTEDLKAYDNVRSAISGSAPTPGIGIHVAQAKPVMQLEHVNSYAGGPAVLLYGGSMMVLASGSLLVLIDLCSTDSTQSIVPQTGFWRYFRSSGGIRQNTGRGGYIQTFIRGHTASIGIIEQSSDGLYLLTGETCAGGKLFLWNLQDGRRVASLVPHVSNVVCASISDDNAQLVTVGGDTSGRVQIIVWDVESLILSSQATTPSNSSVIAEAKKNIVVAKQLSDFPIQKIGFSPFQDKGLVSCGRENIRFWRIKKGHLPGRPVQLNEYSRGFIFSDFSFYADISPASGQERPVVFVASCKGMLLRVDCIKEQVVCAYQLHSGAICSLAVSEGVVITGGEDNRLRVWPLQFNDFLMEAHHESPVTHINISGEGGKFLSVGTISGTVGVLNVFEHSYRTVLRSHVGSITSLSSSKTLGDELLSVGSDGTIRLWDVMSGTQKFEFNSPDDQPLCGTYHPTQHIIACGFRSGAVRIFDVQTTSTLFERCAFSAPVHSGPLTGSPSPVSCISYSKPSMDPRDDEGGRWIKGLSLFALAVDGRLTIFDVDSGYQTIRSSIVCPNVPLPTSTPSKSTRSLGTSEFQDNYERHMFMSLGSDSSLLAVASSTAISSLVVVDTSDLSIIFKVTSSTDRETKKHSNFNGASSFGATIKTGVSYPTSSPYHQPSNSPENDSSPEDAKCDISRKGRSHFHSEFTHSSAISSLDGNSFTVGGKSDRPVIGLQFVSDPSGVGEYIALFTTKHMITIGLGESSSITSAISARRASKVSNIPTVLFSQKPVLHSGSASVVYDVDASFGTDNATPLKSPEHPNDMSTLSMLFRSGWEHRVVKQLMGRNTHQDPLARSTGGEQSQVVSISSSNNHVIHQPHLATFDAAKGLVYLSVSSTTSSTFGGGNESLQSSTTVSMKVIGVTVRRGSIIDCESAMSKSIGRNLFKLHVNVSPPQSYAFPAGGSSQPLLNICSSGSTGRVATASVSGILGIWLLQSDETIQALRQLQHTSSPVWPFGPLKEVEAASVSRTLPTAMAHIFDGEYNYDDQHKDEYTEFSSQKVKISEQKTDVNQLAVDTSLMSPAPTPAKDTGASKNKKPGETMLSRRSPSWSARSTKPVEVPSADAPKMSNSASGSSRGMKLKKSASAEFNSPSAKKLAVTSNTTAKKGATPMKKTFSQGTKEPTTPNKEEDNNSGSLNESFGDSEAMDMISGLPLSLMVEGTSLKAPGSEPLNIKLLDLGKEIREAIKSPMPIEKEVPHSPLFSGIKSPVIVSSPERVVSTVSKPEPQEFSESVDGAIDGHTKEVTADITFLELDTISPPNAEDVISTMEKSFCFEDFIGGKFVGAQESNAGLSREDFLYLNAAGTKDSQHIGLKPPPADMLKSPSGVPELCVHTLSQKYSVAPQYSNERHLLVSSNGSSITLQRTSGGPGILLNKPASVTRPNLSPRHGVVRAMSISPSGDMVAAIVDFYSSNIEKTAYPAELVVWCAGAPTEADSANDPALFWMCLGTVHLQTGPENRSSAGYSKIGWTHEDSLVLAVPVVIDRSISKNNEDESNQMGVQKSPNGCLLSVTHWAEASTAHQAGDKRYVATRSKAAGGIEMPGILAEMPFFSEKMAGMYVASWKEEKLLVGNTASASHESSIRVIFWSGKRICIFSVTCPASTEASIVGKSKFEKAPTATLIWTDETGNQGPLVGVSMAWPTDSIHGFFAREDVMIMGRGLTSRGPSGGLCGLGEESSRYYASLVMPVPVLACLSAAGNLKFIRIRAYASIQTCAPRIPAAHTSGTPKEISLSATGNTLVYGYATAVHVYSVTNHMKEGMAYNVVLGFCFKVLLNFSPTFLLPLTSFREREMVVSQKLLIGHTGEDGQSVSSKRTGSTKGSGPKIEDVLVAGTEGDMGVISSLSKFRRTFNSEDKFKLNSEYQFFRMSSPLSILAPHSGVVASSGRVPVSRLHNDTFLDLAVVPDAGIIATITTTGVLQLTHIQSGISLPFPDCVTPRSCSAIASSTVLLAVGSTCGRVSVYDARSMKVVKILFFPPISKAGSATKVTSLLFVPGFEDETHLVTVLGDGSVCISSISKIRSGAKYADPEELQSITEQRVFRRISSQHLCKSRTFSEADNTSSVGNFYICNCWNAPNTFGIIRGDLIDLFTIETPIAVCRSIDATNSSASWAPKVHRLGKVRLVDAHCSDVKRGNPRAPSTLRVYDVHLLRLDSKLIVSIIGSSVRCVLQPSANIDLWLSVGSLDLPPWRKNYESSSGDASMIQNVGMTRRVALGLDYRQLVNRSSTVANQNHRDASHYRYFQERTCHAFTTSGILFLDLILIHENTELSVSDDAKEFKPILDMGDVARAKLELTSICGSEFLSAVPGDGNRNLHEDATVAAYITTGNESDPEFKLDGSNEPMTALICKSYPSPMLLKAYI